MPVFVKKLKKKLQSIFTQLKKEENNEKQDAGQEDEEQDEELGYSSYPHTPQE